MWMKNIPVESNHFRVFQNLAHEFLFRWSQCANTSSWLLLLGPDLSIHMNWKYILRSLFYAVKIVRDVSFLRASKPNQVRASFLNLTGPMQLIRFPEMFSYLGSSNQQKTNSFGNRLLRQTLKNASEVTTKWSKRGRQTISTFQTLLVSTTRRLVVHRQRSFVIFLFTILTYYEVLFKNFPRT